MELWDIHTINRIRVAVEQARELRELTTRFLPATVESTGRHGDWPISGFAMISRACGTLESVMALFPRRRHTDAAVIARSLYEQVVTFAWIAIDPTENAPAWVRWDRQLRIKADNDLRDVGAEALLDKQTRDDFERQIDEGRVMPDSLADRALAADKHWSQKLETISEDPADPGTFRGMYRYIYRSQSQYGHAAPASLEPYVHNSDTPGRLHVILSEGSPSQTTAFTLSPILYVLMLQVAEPTLHLAGLSAASDDIFARHPVLPRRAHEPETST